MFCYLVRWITFSRAEQNISHKSIHKTIISLYIKQSGSSCRAEAASARSRKRSFFGR